MVVLDLAEFVADRDKSTARAGAVKAVAALRAAGAQVFVQTDPASLADDLGACTGPDLAGIVITRAETARQIAEAATLLDRLERERGLKPGTVEIVTAIETAAGNHVAYDIASASPRITGITLGRADLVMDLRPEPSGEIHLMPYLMQRLIIIAGAAGVMPIGAWWRAPDRGLLATPDNTQGAAQRGRSLGFKGALCLRPDQVEPLNRAYG